MATTKVDTGANNEITATEAREGRDVGLIWVFTLPLARGDCRRRVGIRLDYASFGRLPP
jgi:hypothetical protein